MKNLLTVSVRVLKNRLVRGVLLSIFGAYLLNLFFLSYSLQVPFTFAVRSPVVRKVYQPTREVIRYREVPVTITPSPRPKTEREVIDSLKHAKILHKVYMLESTAGKNDGCRAEGKYNGFGYGQNSSVWNCFSSFEEVAGKVDGWFEKYLSKGYSVDEALCLYNTGVRQPMCTYSMKAASL